MIHINTDSDPTAPADWVNGQDYTATEWGFDVGGIFDSYKMYNGGWEYVPQMVVIDLDGNVRYADLDLIEPDFIISIINELL